MTEYIAIEGSSYTGKTTLVENFAARGYETVPEYDAFGPFSHSTRTYEERKHAALELIRREKIRSGLVEAAKGGVVIADRSPLSLITFEDMMIKTSRTEHESSTRSDIRNFIIDELADAQVQGDIVMPNAFITLRLDSEKEFNDRVQIRGVTSIEALAVFSIQHYIAQRTHRYAEAVAGEDSSRSIDASSQKPQEIFTNVSSIIANMSKDQQINNGITYLKEL